MSDTIKVSMQAENFVVYKNNIRKEMAEIPEEDLEAYKKFEWERAFKTWGKTWENVKNNTERPDLLVQVRDILGYSSIDYPCTRDEIKAANAKYRKEQVDRKEADRAIRAYTLELQLKEQQEAWDRLTPEEQSAQLKQRRKNELQKLAFWAISGILIISGILAYYTV